MIHKIVVASTNEGKVKEVKGVLDTLKDLEFAVESLRDYAITEPDEPYNSFLENAVHKAKYYAKHIQQPTLSDDSGLCIQPLADFPGVKTKDLVEECGTLKKAFARLAGLLKDHKKPTAYFNCAMVLYIPKTDVLIPYEAKMHGTITFPPKGTQGFGFDPIFIPEGFDQTLAELGDSVKNQISHRSKALKGLVEKLRQGL
ncbi:non-canonical purine NTP pyrophosphatase [Candidatus Finniella inopinata]|nr:non-canonical purine NTP pyrophosphatase [Candidatus Finniella inopinata]